MYQRFCAWLRGLAVSERQGQKRPTERSASGKVLHSWDIAPRSVRIPRLVGFLLTLTRLMLTAIALHAYQLCLAPRPVFHREASMVYIQRDEHGKILRVEQQPFAEMTASMAVESEELQNWLNTKLQVQAKLEILQESDWTLIRVLEDVVSVLVEKGLISYTDLPLAARQKLDQRAIARADLEGISDHPDLLGD